MKYILILTFLCLLNSISTLASAEPSLNSSHISFSDWSECNVTKSGKCKILSRMTKLNYQSWGKFDIAMVREDLSLLKEYKNFQKILDLLLDGGKTKVEFIPVDSPRFIASALFYDNSYLIFIDIKKYTKAFAGSYYNHRHSTYVILHELFHHYMFEKTKGYNPASNFFKSLMSASQWRELDLPYWKVGLPTYYKAQVHRRAFAGDLEAEIKFDVSFSQKFGFPTFYSISSVKEYFAELGAFATLNEESLLEYLPEDMVSWLVDQELLLNIEK